MVRLSRRKVCERSLIFVFVKGDVRCRLMGQMWKEVGARAVSRGSEKVGGRRQRRLNIGCSTVL